MPKTNKPDQPAKSMAETIAAKVVDELAKRAGPGQEPIGIFANARHYGSAPLPGSGLRTNEHASPLGESKDLLPGLLAGEDGGRIQKERAAADRKSAADRKAAEAKAEDDLRKALLESGCAKRAPGSRI